MKTSIAVEIYIRTKRWNESCVLCVQEHVGPDAQHPSAGDFCNVLRRRGPDRSGSAKVLNSTTPTPLPSPPSPPPPLPPPHPHTSSYYPHPTLPSISGEPRTSRWESEQVTLGGGTCLHLTSSLLQLRGDSASATPHVSLNGSVLLFNGADPHRQTLHMKPRTLSAMLNLAHFQYELRSPQLGRGNGALHSTSCMNCAQQWT